MSAEVNDRGLKFNLATLAGLIVGLLVGQYAGVHLLIPLAGAGITHFALKKLAPTKRAAWFPAISVQTGHAIWFILGFLVLGQFDVGVLDPLLLLLGSLWLLLKPGAPPVLTLSCLQLAGFAYNSYLFMSTDLGTSANRALLVHILLRGLAIGFMSLAWIKSRREAPSVAPAI